MVTMENYEEYFMLYADGELTAAQQQELNNFIAQHPELAKEMETWGMAHITADETIVYANKKALLKTEPPRKAIWLGKGWMYSAAAAVVILMVLAAIYKYTHSTTANSDAPQIAKKDIPANVPTPVTPQVTDTAVKSIVPQPPKPETVVTAQPHKPAMPHETQKHNTPKEEVVQQPVMPKNTQITVQERVTEQPIPQPKPRDIETPTPVKETPAIANNNNPTTNETNTVAPKKNFIDRLPIDDEKKAGLQTLASAVETISDAKVSLNLKEKRLTINF